MRSISLLVMEKIANVDHGISVYLDKDTLDVPAAYLDQMMDSLAGSVVL